LFALGAMVFTAHNNIRYLLRQGFMRTHMLRAASAAVVLTLLSTPTFAKSAATETTAASEAASAVDIFNFGQVSSAYYRGGELKGHAALDLAKLGVKTVVDLRSDGDYDADEAQLAAGAHLNYVRIPMTTRTAPSTEQIEKFLKVVTDPANQPVYVHCVEGRHRTGVMTAVYRMTIDGWTADRAFDEMKHYKFGMDFLHPEFKKFVYAYRPTPAAPPTGILATGVTVAAAN
jgi:protein tyrosine/serine phosphatase